MNEQNSQDLQTLQARLEAVRSDLDQALDAAVHRANTMRIALIVFVVIIIGYLTWSYGALKENVTVDAVFGLASQRLDEFMAGGEEKVANALIDAAPDVINDVASRIVAVPGMAADHIRNYVDTEVQARLPEIEKEITEGLILTIDRAHAEAEQSSDGKLDEAQFNALTARVAAEYGNHVRKLVGQARGMFSEQIDKMSAAGEERMAKALIDAAPNVIDQLAAQVADAPGLITSEIRMRVRNEIETAIPELEVQVIDSLKETVTRVHAKAEEEAGGELDEEAFNKVTANIAAEYGKQVRKMLKDAQGRYDEHADQLFGYLHTLASADDKALNDRQKHHRVLVLSVLAVLEKYASENPNFLFLAPDAG